MKKTADKYKSSYQNLPKLPEMRKLWHAGYWDGPLSGMCLIDGQKCWFECIEEWYENNKRPYSWEDESEEALNWELPWYRRYLIVKLTDEQLEPIERHHEKWKRMVGSHCDYDENGHREYFHYNETITKETVAQYYEEAKLEPPLELEATSPEHVLGWYEYKWA